jgi:hypothetical protein
MIGQTILHDSITAKLRESEISVFSLAEYARLAGISSG